MPASIVATFTNLVQLVQTHSPKFRVAAKRRSKLHRFITWCLRFPWVRGKEIDSTYMSDCWTTLGHTASYPGPGGSQYKEWPVVPHEGIHSIQAQRNTVFGFSAAYLLGTPVYGILGALLTILMIPLFVYVIPWPWLFLPLGVGALLSSPVPFGYWRAKWEWEAYTITIAIQYWRFGRVDDDYLEWIAEEFKGPSYFWMYPYRRKVAWKLHNIRKDIILGRLFTDKKYGLYAKRLFYVLQHLGHIEVDYRS